MSDNSDGLVVVSRKAPATVGLFDPRQTAALYLMPLALPLRVIHAWRATSAVFRQRARFKKSGDNANGMVYKGKAMESL
ncbi:hypothetical protein PSHT_04211, partial [Puccinia striiformis]